MVYREMMEGLHEQGMHQVFAMWSCTSLTLFIELGDDSTQGTISLVQCSKGRLLMNQVLPSAHHILKTLGFLFSFDVNRCTF